jgi:hypothetical protein
MRRGKKASVPEILELIISRGCHFHNDRIYGIMGLLETKLEVICEDSFENTLYRFSTGLSPSDVTTLAIPTPSSHPSVEPCWLPVLAGGLWTGLSV